MNNFLRNHKTGMLRLPRPSSARSTLYTYLFETEMMITWKTNGLKGQFNIAQGNTLGFGSENIIVRAKSPSMEKFILRTKWNGANLMTYAMLNSVRVMVSFLANIVPRTVLSAHFLPGALPRAEVSWPFRPEKRNDYLCIKSSRQMGLKPLSAYLLLFRRSSGYFKTLAVACADLPSKG
jgi:hypothetical protein